MFHIYFKARPFTFHSPWPPDSPFYYSPTPVQFWMPFDGGEGLHDASWRSDFGPGSNLGADRSTAHFIEVGPKEKLEVAESLAVTGPTLLKTAVMVIEQGAETVRLARNAFGAGADRKGL